MSLNGRQKGNANERKVAALCQAWWSRIDPDCEFVRVPLSGGWGTSKTRGTFHASGDIMTTSKTFPFVVEVKARENWSVDNVMKGVRSPIWEWWRQTIKAAKEQENGVPMMWFRKCKVKPGKPAFPWLMMLPAEYQRARTLPEPDVYFPAPSKQGVNYGGVHPVMYFADRIIAIHPKDIL